MNVTLLTNSPDIAGLIRSTEHLFSEVGIPSPRLDAEVLLAYVLDVDRSSLIAHSKDSLEHTPLEHFLQLVKRRLNREPVAYIVGKKEFYGREFIVTPEVLIPRPETEDLIDMANEYFHDIPAARLLDVGTGSGAIGLTLKLELPNAYITISDISHDSLEIAKKNAQHLNAKPMTYIKSNLLEYWMVHKKPFAYAGVVANLPYVDKSWKVSPELDHEPTLALYADEGGLALIKQLIIQCSSLLTSGSFLLLEADPEQHIAIADFARAHDLRHKKTNGYAISFVKQS